MPGLAGRASLSFGRGRFMSASEPDSGAEERQPGTNGVWTFVFIDMIVFSLIFVTYLSERIRLPEIFAAAQERLSFFFGLSNAVILLTSSLFMVEAVRAAREQSPGRVRGMLMACLACGALFALNKIIEYHGKLSDGITPAANSFYSFYYFITGAHFLHVLGGMVFIASCRQRAATDIGNEAYRRMLENVGLFWHFVDLLWLFIFPLIYLAGIQ